MLRRLIAASFAVAACASHAEASVPTLSLAVSGNMSVCIESLDAAFLKLHPGLEIKVSTGASGTLFAQIRTGAPFDIFISSDMDYPRKLIDAGLAKADTLRAYGYGRLALWTNTPGINPGRGRTVLVSASTDRIAIADPDTGAYGRAAMEALEKLNVLEAAKPKLMLGENTMEAIEFVRSGKADIGIVPYSLLVVPPLKGVGLYVVLPGGSYAPIEQGAVVTQKGASNPLAKAYVEFLGSDIARDILEENGYALPELPAGKRKS